MAIAQEYGDETPSELCLMALGRMWMDIRVRERRDRAQGTVQRVVDTRCDI